MIERVCTAYRMSADRKSVHKLEMVNLILVMAVVVVMVVLVITVTGSCCSLEHLQ